MRFFLGGGRGHRCRSSDYSPRYTQSLRQTSYIDVGDTAVDPPVFHLSNRLDKVLPVRKKRTDLLLNMLTNCHTSRPSHMTLFSWYIFTRALMMFERVRGHIKSISKQLRLEKLIVSFLDFSLMVSKFISH